MVSRGDGGFLSRFKKRPLVLNAPVIGRSIRIEEVPDQAFAQKMMGDGAAYLFDGDTIYAPCDSQVTLFAGTKHAIGLVAQDIEILLHVGIDTVALKGEGFTALVSEGDFVAQGQPLLKLDRDLLSARSANLTTMMVIISETPACTVHMPGDVTLSSPSISF